MVFVVSVALMVRRHLSDTLGTRAPERASKYPALFPESS